MALNRLHDAGAEDDGTTRLPSEIDEEAQNSRKWLVDDRLLDLMGHPVLTQTDETIVLEHEELQLEERVPMDDHLAPAMPERSARRARPWSRVAAV